MNQKTKWFEHPLFYWAEKSDLNHFNEVLKNNLTEKAVEDILFDFDAVALESIAFFPSGTYCEPEKTILDNIGDFWLVSMKQRVGKNHVGTFRVYLPVDWNGRFMGIAGAGTNTEVDWFTSPTFNVLSWPIALKNGYACAVADNDTGIRLDCTWGFDENGELEWDQIEGWVHRTYHEATVCAKAITVMAYGEKIKGSYFHGTSGGGRQVITEAVRYPDDYDGLWADGPAVNHHDLVFSSLWPAVVESNEKHTVSLEKYQAAYALARFDSTIGDRPFDPKEACWINFINKLIGMETKAGPITQKDLEVMVKTWDGPRDKDGQRMAYGFGPAIREWPLSTGNQLYGYYKRRKDGKLILMPIAEQLLRWYAGDPHLDIYSLSYLEFEQLYRNAVGIFKVMNFSNPDLRFYAQKGGKLFITQGTGDCVVPYQGVIDYYRDSMNLFPSEKIMNKNIRMYMPPFAGHSILDWSGPAVPLSDGMRALTDWVEKGKVPETLPVIRYDFEHNLTLIKSEVSTFRYWEYKRRFMKKY